MSYSIERAVLIASQIERLATQNPHQLAGQAANLDFWMAEAAHAIATLDDYPSRFHRLRDAQVGWVEAHGTKVSGYCPQCRGACEFGPDTPPPPRRTPSAEIDAARDRVRLAVRRYLLRLYRAHLPEEDAVRRTCAEIGVSIEAEDLRRDASPADGDAPPAPGTRSRRER